MGRFTTIEVFAPAKVNLCLHVVGQRDDGYHLLDSIVAFADVGDRLRVTLGGQQGRLVALGPEAGNVPVDMDNLILKVATLFSELDNASFELTKNLPVASGIGGGSTDAAAAFRAGMALRSAPSSGAEFDAALLKLGADIPMCLIPTTSRIRGIGEDVKCLSCLPDLHAVLVNPRVGVATPQVFKAMTRRHNAPLAADLPVFDDAQKFVDWLADQRNDMQDAAIALEPSIAKVLAALNGVPSCLLARMSGSGATCFALFQREEQAKAAAVELQILHPDWWVQPTRLGCQNAAATPECQ